MENLSIRCQISLNGFLEKKAYVKQSMSYKVKRHENKIFKLNKVLYGLNQVPRAWYSRIDGYFLKNRFVKCLNEYAIYIKIKESGDTLIVCLYVDDLIFTGNNPIMTNIGLMSYYLGVKFKQGEDGIFVNQETFVGEVFNKFRMEDCAKVNTPVECGVRMSKNDEEGTINFTTLKNLVGRLRYWKCTHLNIFFGVGLVGRFIKTITITHFKTLK